MDPTLQAVIDKVKREERSDIKPRDWSKFEFATRRAKEVEEACSRQWGNVMRIDCSATYEEFAEIEKMCMICIIKGVTDEWPQKDWSFEALTKRWGEVRWKVGKDDDGHTLRLGMTDYMTYVRQQEDDSPLYIFDHNLGDKTTRKELRESYAVPKYFPDDLMSFIEDRPPYKWFLLGPRRSGTCMHTDPLNTSAWNTLLSGKKKWAFLPSHIPRRVAKGRTVMKPNEDDEAVNFFVDLLPRLRAQGIEVVEVVQNEGETIFVPSGWWHVVMNITDTVAVTQNYCGRHNFDSVWRTARVERPCMSKKWLARMMMQAPAYAHRAKLLNETDNFDLELLIKHNEVRRQRKKERHRLRAMRQAKLKWEAKNKGDWDADAWAASYAPSSDSDSDSTVSTSTSSSDTDSSTSTCTTSSE